MSKGIKVSEKHGVNPSIDTCFYCGKETGIALFGKLPNDKEAPARTCSSLEPCDECKEKYKDYLLLIEVSDDSTDKKVNVTGRWIGIKKEILKENMQNSRIAYCRQSEFTDILSNAQADKDGE